MNQKTIVQDIDKYNKEGEYEADNDMILHWYPVYLKDRICAMRGGIKI